MRILLIISVSLMLSACSGMQWVQASKDAKPLQKSLDECQFEIDKATDYSVSGIEQGFKNAEIRKSCMKVKGWVLTYQNPNSEIKKVNLSS